VPTHSFLVAARERQIRLTAITVRKDLKKMGLEAMRNREPSPTPKTQAKIAGATPRQAYGYLADHRDLGGQLADDAAGASSYRADGLCLSADGVVDLLSCPAADVAAAVQEHFEQADSARIVDLDPGIAHRADGDRQSEALQ
jgi:hypothetical protein